MKLIGYILIILSAINLAINIPFFLAILKMKSLASEEFASADHEKTEVFAPHSEYHGGLVIMSIGALAIGVYMVLNHVTFGQFFGLLLLFSALGGLVQSFRPFETQGLLAQSGDYTTSASTMAWRLRIMAAIALSVGLYLIF